MEAGGTSIAVLGTLQVRRGDDLVAVSGHRRATILVTLALSAGRPVSHQVLADRAWVEQPPRSVESSLHSHISRLRQSLGPDSIRTLPGGYLLDVDPDRVDALRFRRQVEEASRMQDPGEARAKLEEALRLWRGEPFAGLRSEVLHRDLAPSLVEDHLRALERRIDLDLAAGRHGELIAELRDLIGRHPLRETFWRQLITAQERAGRPADALDSYDRIRTELRDRLGATPSNDLQTLYHRLLNDSGSVLQSTGSLPDTMVPYLSVTMEVPRQLPPDIGDFVGREHEIAQIRSVLTAVDIVGASRIVFLSGPGGIGKTTLAVHVGHQVRAAFPDGQVHVDMHGAGSNPAQPEFVIASLLRALGVSATSIPDAMDERVDLYRSLMADRRLLLILDNVKDENQIQDLLPTNANSAVIVTGRQRMAGLWGGHLIELGVLSESDGALLLERVIGTVRFGGQGEDARRLVRLSGGLPLALRVVGARLVAKPHWRLDVLAARLVDTRHRLNELTYGDLDVRASLALSYGGLSDGAKLMLLRLSLLTVPDFPLWAGAALLDIGLGEAEVFYEDLIDAQLLDVVDGSCGLRYRLHDLVAAYAREYAFDKEGASVGEAALRRVFGGWLALVEYADRRLNGGDFGVVHGDAVRWYPDSDAVSLVIDADPLAWLDAERFAIGAVVQQSAELGFDELCWDLAWTAETLFEAHSYFDDWRAGQAHALRAARRAGNLRGEAAMQTTLSALLIKQKGDPEAAELGVALALFDKAGDSQGKACVQNNIGPIELIRGNLEAAAQAFENAYKILDAAGRYDACYSLRGLAQVQLERGDLESAEHYLLEGLKIVGQRRGPRARALLLDTLGGLRMGQRRFGEAADAYRKALDLIRRSHGDFAGEAHVLGGLGRALGGDKDDQAEPVLQDALQLSRRLGERHTEARALLSLGELAAAHGHTSAAIDHLQQSLSLFKEISTPLWETRAQQALDSLQEPAS